MHNQSAVNGRFEIFFLHFLSCEEIFPFVIPLSERRRKKIPLLPSPFIYLSAAAAISIPAPLPLSFYAPGIPMRGVRIMHLPSSIWRHARRVRDFFSASSSIQGNHGVRIHLRISPLLLLPPSIPFLINECYADDIKAKESLSRKISNHCDWRFSMFLLLYCLHSHAALGNCQCRFFRRISI